jgi:hypothetical protein
MKRSFPFLAVIPVVLFIKSSKRKILQLSLLISIFLFSSSFVFAQKQKEISLSVYPGFTIVNFEEALGYPDDYMTDWSQFYFSAVVRGFLNAGKSFHFGAEISWEQLYYAYYVVPYGMYPVYREFNVSTFSVMALARYSINKFFVIGGMGANFFNEGVAPALCLEVGYMIHGGGKVKFPVSFRLNPIFGDGTPTPVSIGLGLSYSIR